VLKGFKFKNEWSLPDSERCIAYNLIDPDNELKDESWKDVAVLINPYPEPKLFTIPQKKWCIVVNGENSGVETLGITMGGQVDVDGISMMVLYSSDDDPSYEN